MSQLFDYLSATALNWMLGVSAARSFNNFTDRLLFCVAIIKLANEFFQKFSANLIDAKFGFPSKYHTVQLVI
jgi:hypothetical protein